MWKDPLVEEVRKIRDQQAKKFKYDLKEIFKDLKKAEKRTPHKVVSYSPTPYIKPTGT